MKRVLRRFQASWMREVKRDKSEIGGFGRKTDALGNSLELLPVCAWLLQGGIVIGVNQTARQLFGEGEAVAKSEMSDEAFYVHLTTYGKLLDPRSGQILSDQEGLLACLSNSGVDLILKVQKSERAFRLQQQSTPSCAATVVVVATEITEFHKNQEASSAQTRSFSLMVRTLEEAQRVAGLGHWQVNLETGAMEYSREFRHLLGLGTRMDHFALRDLLCFVPSRERVRLLRSALLTIKGERNATGNLRLFNLQNQERVIFFHMKSSENIRAQRMLFGICQDITHPLELERATYYDQLTQLYNRDKFYDLIAREIALNNRYAQPLSFILFNIDNFESLQEAEGQEVGDRVLIEVANVASREIRNTDILARWGGEEFVIVAPQTSIEGARILAEKLRSNMRQVALDDALKNKTITCSFGVTNVCAQEALESIIKRANELLCEAKSLGKDRVVALGV